MLIRITYSQTSSIYSLQRLTLTQLTRSPSGTGSGRLVFGGDATYTVTKNLIHSYYGKKGAIDVVIQDLAEMEMVDDPYQRAKIIRADAIYGIFTFADGKPQFLDVLLQS